MINPSINPSFQSIIHVGTDSHDWRDQSSHSSDVGLSRVAFPRSLFVCAGWFVCLLVWSVSVFCANQEVSLVMLSLMRIITLCHGYLDKAKEADTRFPQARDRFPSSDEQPHYVFPKKPVRVDSRRLIAGNVARVVHNVDKKRVIKKTREILRQDDYLRWKDLMKLLDVIESRSNVKAESRGMEKGQNRESSNLVSGEKELCRNPNYSEVEKTNAVKTSSRILMTSHKQ